MSRFDSSSERRQARVADFAYEALPTLDPPALVIEDEGRLHPRLPRTALWARLSVGDRVGDLWPPDGPFQTIAMRLPRERQAFIMAAHAAAARLTPTGRLFVYGANDEGIRSADRKLQEIFAQVRTFETRRKCRLWLAAEPNTTLRPNLADWAEPLHLNLHGESLPWVTFPGLFAKGKLDHATSALLKALPKVVNGDILDFGCGTGVISAALHRRGARNVHALDADALAIEATRRNVPQARTWLGDGWRALPKTKKFDRVVSNPPFHRGKSEDFRVVKELIAGAAGRTRELWIVTQRQIPLDELLKPAFSKVKVVSQTTRVAVWKAW